MKLRTGYAVVLVIVLVVFAVGFGAYRGWSQERQKVEETYAGLESMLHTRVESAYNLLAVARRHLEESDEAVKRVIRDRDILEGSGALRGKAEANEALTKDAQALLDRLAQLDSVKNDSRDQMYVSSYLPQMMEQSEEKTAGANYNQAAVEFNRKMDSTFSGLLARIMGIQHAQQFIAP